MTTQITGVSINVALDVDGLDLAERLRKSLRGLQNQLTRGTRPTIAKSFIDPRVRRLAGEFDKAAQSGSSAAANSVPSKAGRVSTAEAA